jgi:hypothetical protein
MRGAAFVVAIIGVFTNYALAKTQKEIKSSDVVKMSVTANKPSPDGKQTVIVTLTIAPSWSIFGHARKSQDRNSC